jgi:hypothetical protein
LCNAEKLNLIYDNGDFGSKIYIQGYGGAYGVVWLGLRLVEVLSQSVGFCWCLWQESRFSRHEDVFTFHLR